MGKKANGADADSPAEKLTEKQRKFCEYYIQSLNAADAARKAGYSEKTACEIGIENLRKPQIQDYIGMTMEKLQSERIAGADEVLRYLTGVMRGRVEGRDGDDPISIADRTKAAELLGKRYRMFVDRQEMTASVEAVTIVDDIPRRDGD